MIFPKVYATCPVCIATVGGGLLLAKRLGIDDFLVSIWISGLNTALAYYLASKIKRGFLNSPLLWSVSFYTITLFYLLATEQIGFPGNTILGIDKVLLGLTIGLSVFLFSMYIDKYLRYLNHGKVFINYQKVIIPSFILLIATLLSKLLLRL